MKIINSIIILITKLIIFILNILGKKAGTIPGRIALKLNKNIRDFIKTDAKIIVITGTNGKTTTTNMLYEILEKSNNTNMDTIVVNGKIITPRADGTYYTGIKHSDTQINVKATAEDTYAITKIDNINNLVAGNFIF